MKHVEQTSDQISQPHNPSDKPTNKQTFRQTNKQTLCTYSQHTPVNCASNHGCTVYLPLAAASASSNDNPKPTPSDTIRDSLIERPGMKISS